MTATARLSLLSDAVDETRDFIERLCALNHGENDDAISDAITAAENIRGDLWKAAARAESQAAVETMREEARDLAAYRRAVV